MEGTYNIKDKLQQMLIISKIINKSRQQKKVMQNKVSEYDKQNLQLIITTADNQQNGLNTFHPPNKQLTKYTPFDIKHIQNEKQILIYIQLSIKQIKNAREQLIKKKGFQDIKKGQKDNILYQNHIILENNVEVSSKICLNCSDGFNVKLEIQYHSQVSNMIAYPAMRIFYQTQKSWKNTWLQAIKTDIKTDPSQLKQEYNFEVELKEIQKTSQKLLLQINLDKKRQNSKTYFGITNQGNTCYINSFIQVLYHFLPLQKLILERSNKQKNTFLSALSNAFIKLKTAKSAINIQQLLKHFSKTSYDQCKQQDIHEFMIKFFDELQQSLPQTTTFWTGEDLQIITSKQHQYYKSKPQKFTQLQLFTSKQQQNKFKKFQSIQKSLRHLLQQQKIVQPIDIQKLGKIHVNKSRKFCKLPPLLFINIKRYQYDTIRKQLKKIYVNLPFPNQINLNFLVGSNADLYYILYAVIVHKGRTTDSGHYFCFVNVSKNLQQPEWYQFNDGMVRKAKNQSVLKNYTGENRKLIQINQQYGKWVYKQQPSQQTVYLLVYIQKQYFIKQQSLQIKLPSHVQKIIKQRSMQEQLKYMVAVQVLVLKNFGETSLFQKKNDSLIHLKLYKEKLFIEEIKRCENQLSCKVGSIWKVNCKTKNIKYIHNNYGQKCRITVNRLTQMKQGIRQPDYFIVVPIQMMKQIQNGYDKKLGMLHVEQQRQSEITYKIFILTKDQISNRAIQWKRKDGEYQEDQMEYFLHGWKDYLYVKRSII